MFNDGGVPKGNRTYVEAENPRKSPDRSLTDPGLGLNAPDAETTSLHGRVSGRPQCDPGRAQDSKQRVALERLAAGRVRNERRAVATSRALTLPRIPNPE